MLNQIFFSVIHRTVYKLQKTNCPAKLAFCPFKHCFVSLSLSNARLSSKKIWKDKNNLPFETNRKINAGFSLCESQMEKSKPGCLPDLLFYNKYALINVPQKKKHSTTSRKRASVPDLLPLSSQSLKHPLFETNQNRQKCIWHRRLKSRKSQSFFYFYSS